MIKAMTLFTILLMTALPVATQKRDQRLEAEIRRVNAEEVESLLRNDVKALERLWSDDLVVTNPLNTFVNKREVLRLIVSGVLAFRSYDRRIEHIKLHENLAVVAGSETFRLGRQNARCRKKLTAPLHRIVAETEWPLATGSAARKHCGRARSREHSDPMTQRSTSPL